MKTEIKKSTVKKSKVLGAKSDKDIRRQQSEDAIPKSAVKKDISKKEDKKAEINFEEIVTPSSSSIKDIKKEDLDLYYSSANLVIPAEAGIQNTTTSEAIEERKEKDAEEFLPATEEALPVSEVEKSNNHSYVLIVAGIIVVIAIFTITIFVIYKMLFSSQKTTPVVVPVVNQQVVVPVPEVVIPVEKINIADPVVTVESKKQTIATIANPKTLKESSAFKSFTYDASIGKQIALSGTCHDKYYAFLIFDSKIDYRKDPGMAQSNKAFACPANGHFTVDINLKDINLQSGNYYLFVADQGNTGSWYNPR